MMRLVSVLWIIAAFGICAVEAVGATSQSVSEVMAKDDRLDCLVTLSIEDGPLDEVCDQLSQLGGVKLRVRESIHNDQVILLCKDRPLRDVMHAIADVWSYEWRLADTEEGEPTEYVLAMPSRTQAKRERLLKELAALHDRELRNDLDRQSILAGDFRKMLEMGNPIAFYDPDMDDSPSNREQWQAEMDKRMAKAYDTYKEVYGADLPSSGPERDEAECLALQLAYPEARIVLSHLMAPMTIASIPPDAVPSVLKGGFVDIAIPSQQGYFEAPDRLREILLEAHGKPIMRIYTDELIEAIVANYPDHQTREQYRHRYEELNERARRISVAPPEPIIIRFTTEWPQPEYSRITYAIWRIQSGIQSSTDLAATSMVSDPLPAEMNPALYGTLDEEEAKKPIRFKAASSKEPDDPESATCSFSDTLCQLREQIGCDIVAQRFSCEAKHKASQEESIESSEQDPQVDNPVQQSQGKTLERYLQEMCTTSDIAVESANRWLLFRRPDAYVRRLEEPPRRLVRKWLESESEYGCITLNDLMEIAQLPQWQYNLVVGKTGVCIEGFRRPGILQVVSGEAMSGDDMRGALSFIVALSPERRKAYLEGQCFRASDLAPNERASIMQLFEIAEIMETWQILAENGLVSDGDSKTKLDPFAAFLVNGPYHLKLYDPKTEKRWSESRDIEWGVKDDQKGLDLLRRGCKQQEGLNRLRRECEEEGLVVEEMTCDPAPSVYTIALEDFDPDSGKIQFWADKKIQLHRIEKPKEELKPSEEAPRSDTVPQIQ